MTVEVALLFSGISLACSIYFGIVTARRNKSKDDQEDATQLTTVIVKLENIGSICSEIKTELQAMKLDVKDHERRIVVVEERSKSAHKRIDDMKGEIKE